MSTRSILRSFLTVVFVVSALMLIGSTLNLAKAEHPTHSSIITCAGSIQACIDAASNGDTIVIPAGTYTESLTLSKPVSLTGVNSTTTIIHAVAGQRVLTVTGATISNSVVISGLTFTGGSADYGGGIYADAPLLVMNARFISSTAIRGGGLYIVGEASLSDVDFEDNTATDLGGGVNARNGTLNLTRAVFVHNSGSAVYSENSPATIIDSHFEHNSGGVGGAVWMYYVGANIGHTDFISNTAEDGGGGVTMVDGSIINSRFEGNATQVYWGGGLYAMGTTLVTNTDFVSNAARTNGGGAYFGDAQLYNSRFEHNTSLDGGGGGLFGFQVLISNTEFVSNHAGCNSWGCGGGGAFAYNEAIVVDSHFENNVAGNGGNGGGLYASTFITTTNTDFISNSAEHGSGGALSAPAAFITGGQFERNSAATGGGVSAGYAFVSDTTFISNTANIYQTVSQSYPGVGGGIYSTFGMVVTDSRFEGNQCAGMGCLGGTLYSSANVAVVNSLFIRNNAPDGGAVLVSAEPNGKTVFLHSTIVDTSLNPSSAISVSNGTLTITDTIITSHTIGISNTGGTVYEDYNLFFGNITNTIGVTGGGHSLIGDPRFVDPSHDDYHLRFDSAAIDHGIDAGVYTDLDGHMRPAGRGFDIGAYEYPGPIYLPIVLRNS